MRWTFLLLAFLLVPSALAQTDPDATLTSPDVEFGVDFGRAVSIDGATAAVGAPGAEEGDRDTGAVTLFSRQPDGTWVQGQRLVPSGLAGSRFNERERFGVALALDGAIDHRSEHIDLLSRQQAFGRYVAIGLESLNGFCLQNCHKPNLAHRPQPDKARIRIRFQKNPAFREHTFHRRMNSYRKPGPHALIPKSIPRVGSRAPKGFVPERSLNRACLLGKLAERVTCV